MPPERDKPCCRVQFYQLAKGARFEFRGKQFQKIAMSMAEDGERNGNVFQGETEVTPIGEPNWASWDLTTSDIGTASRSSSFFVDTNLPTNFYWVGTSEYSGSGYDRGHLCPSADRTDTTNDNAMVFYMSNIMTERELPPDLPITFSSSSLRWCHGLALFRPSG